MDGELMGIERALGSSIVASTEAPWGSKNRTMAIRLADGRRLVLQRYADRRSAQSRVHALEQLSGPLSRRGVPTPRVLAHDLAAEVPWAVFEEMPGEVGYVAAGDDLSSGIFPSIATGMGAVIRVMHDLDAGQFDLPRLWTRPAALRDVATEQLHDLAPYLSTADVQAAEAVIGSVPELFADRPVAVNHGDFGPQNVLVVDDGIGAVLDFEDARVADPLLDVAWWAWLVRAHTPAAFADSWTVFLEAAGVDAEADHFDDRVLALVVLRLLETADAFRRTRPSKHASWARRLSSTLGWRGRPIALVPSR